MNIEWLNSEEKPVTVSTLTEMSDDRWTARMEQISPREDLLGIATVADVRQDVQFDTTPTIPASGGWTSGHVMLSGRVDVQYVDGGGCAWLPNSAYFLTLKSWGGRYCLGSGQQIRHFNYMIRADALDSMLDGDVPDELKVLVSPDLDHSRKVPLPITARMRNVAEDLLQSPLTGALRALEIEGATIQLVALMAHGFRTMQRKGDGWPTREVDGERVAMAREILLDNIADPPTLGALAKQVGLSEKRLNAGFKSLYGATVFELLRNERLAHARYAIANEDVPLKQIAHRVGYIHVTNFINAFTKHFGLPPRTYQSHSLDE